MELNETIELLSKSIGKIGEVIEEILDKIAEIIEDMIEKVINNKKLHYKPVKSLIYPYTEPIRKIRARARSNV